MTVLRHALPSNVITTASSRLDRPDSKLTVDTPDLLPDANLVVLLVHVMPAEPRELTSPQPYSSSSSSKRTPDRPARTN